MIPVILLATMFSGPGEAPLAMLVLRLLLFLLVPVVVVVALTKTGGTPGATGIWMAAVAEGVERPLCGECGRRIEVMAGLVAFFGVPFIAATGMPSQ